MSEIWKAIPEFEGYYEVSSCGIVRSLPRLVNRRGFDLTVPGGIRPPQTQAGGYKFVNLSRDRKVICRRIGYLVLLAFVGPRPAGCEVSHLNGIRTDDRLENLTWETKKQNNARKRQHGTNGAGSHNAMAVLTEAQVEEIRKEYRYRVNSTALGKKYGVDPKHIWRIANRHRWNHV